MDLAIEISDDEASPLTAEADRRGLTVKTLARPAVLDLLDRKAEFERAARSVLAKNKTLSERLRWRGCQASMSCWNSTSSRSKQTFPNKSGSCSTWRAGFSTEPTSFAGFRSEPVGFAEPRRQLSDDVAPRTSCIRRMLWKRGLASGSGMPPRAWRSASSRTASSMPKRGSRPKVERNLLDSMW